MAYFRCNSVNGSGQKVATGGFVTASTTHYENIGFKPKYLVVNENNSSSPTLRLVSVYSEDSSTSQIVFSNLATGASGFSALPNSATHRINSIDDKGFTIKPASSATAYWNYFAIGDMGDTPSSSFNGTIHTMTFSLKNGTSQTVTFEKKPKFLAYGAHQDVGGTLPFQVGTRAVFYDNIKNEVVVLGASGVASNVVKISDTQFTFYGTTSAAATHYLTYID